MRERLFLAGYGLWVVGLGVWHSELLMVMSLLAGLLLGGALCWRILWRAVSAVAIFVGSVSLAYALFGAAPEALVLINLRALAITQLTFTLVARVNLHRAFGFSPMLGMLYGLTYAQILLLRGLLNDYYDGLRSRGATVKNVVKTTQIQPLLATLFGTMLHKSAEQTMAMRSRGLIDD